MKRHNKEFIMSEIERLERLSAVYCDRDWTRYLELKAEIKKLDMLYLEVDEQANLK